MYVYCECAYVGVCVCMCVHIPLPDLVSKLTLFPILFMISAVVESRRIFRKLKAYVTYRFAATMQIVIVLSMLIYISNCTINPLFIIILALFNDLTMLPIAYDQQQASRNPENPDVFKMILTSFVYGTMETIFSLIFAYGAEHSGIFDGDYRVTDCNKDTQGAIWLQMFIAAELLIFVTRAPKLIIFSLAPSPALFVSVITGCIVCSLMAGCASTFGGLAFVDIVLIWAFDIICLAFMDLLKVGLAEFFNEQTDVLPDQVETGSISDKPKKHGASKDLEATGTEVDGLKEHEDFSRASMSANRLTEWAMHNDTRLSSVDHTRTSKAARNLSTNHPHLIRESMSGMGGRMSVSQNIPMARSTDLRNSFVSANLRPNIPSNRTKY
ncbi:hypothetical protein EON63_00595 [archaeon]|nr:MAG: hypothetical protein EON63_00595 [archaeon]